ncbi:12074_t:CDS:2, partial [Entrophospora sp. SA101]
FVNQLKPGYILSTRHKLANDFVNEEVANVNVKTDLEIRRQNHMTLDNPSVITNREVNELLRVRNFFADVEILCDILKPIKEAVISLQANNTNLRFDDFSDYEGYLLSYFLHPLYSGKRFENKEFKNITGIAGKFAKNFGYGFDSINELLFQILENLAKIHTYYVTNAKKEFNYYGKDLSGKEVTSKCILSTMNLGEGFEDENDFLTDYDEYENTNSDDDDLNIELDDNVTTLKIEEIIDLNDSIFNIDQNNDNINENQEVSRNESTEYNVEELVSRFLTDYDNM